MLYFITSKGLISEETTKKYFIDLVSETTSTKHFAENLYPLQAFIEIPIMKFQDWPVDWNAIESVVMGGLDPNTGETLPNGVCVIRRRFQSGQRHTERAEGLYREFEEMYCWSGIYHRYCGNDGK